MTKYHTTFESPVWSPDGTRVAAIRSDDRVGIVVLRGDGTLLKDVRHRWLRAPLNWLPRGIAFRYSDLKARRDKIVVLEGNTETEIASFPRITNLGWDKQGRRVVALVSKRKGGAKYDDMYIIDLPQGRRKKVPQWRYSSTFALSPDGKMLACVSKDHQQLVLLEIETGGEETVYESTGNRRIGNPVWSPDGQVIGFDEGCGDCGFAYYLLDLSLRRRPVKLRDGIMVKPRWSPDGRRIVYCSVGVPGMNVLRVLELKEDWLDLLRREQ